MFLNELTPGVNACTAMSRLRYTSLGCWKAILRRLPWSGSPHSALETFQTFVASVTAPGEEIALTGVHDITTLRFQPYRLAGSKCFDEGDARINCIACHDPHLEVDTVAEHYDSRCLACHTGAKTKPPVCKVWQNGMYQLPHAQTRVARRAPQICRPSHPHRQARGEVPWI